jgi:hypothetical protein
MSKNSNPKILLEKIVEYKPKYFHFAGLGNQNVAKAPRGIAKYFLEQNRCISVTRSQFFPMDFFETKWVFLKQIVPNGDICFKRFQYEKSDKKHYGNNSVSLFFGI